MHVEDDDKLNIQQEQRSLDAPAGDSPGLGRVKALGWTSVLFALLQSLCTAVLTISGFRVAIGLSALAAASGIYAPAKGWHQDAIRIPMLIVATIGAVVNLAVLAWIRHLRTRSSAQWRRRERSAREKRSERLQIVLAVVTLILVALEIWTHPMVHRTGTPPPCRIAGNCT
jgi:formate hydrogenlyase subunit 3/multisubunit Na+/H+ antiporter MnhD subunit